MSPDSRSTFCTTYTGVAWRESAATEDGEHGPNLYGTTSEGHLAGSHSVGAFCQGK